MLFNIKYKKTERKYKNGYKYSVGNKIKLKTKSMSIKIKTCIIL